MATVVTISQDTQDYRPVMEAMCFGHLSLLKRCIAFWPGLDRGVGRQVQVVIDSLTFLDHYLGIRFRYLTGFFLSCVFYSMVCVVYAP